jgi:predicted N-acetyltransferase YhbS
MQTPTGPCEFAPVEEESDLRAALEVSHVAFSRGGTLLHGVARRMRLELFHGAQWWLGREPGGEVAASLVCYPLSFALPGEPPREGFGLGSVGTHPRWWGKGLASGLCSAVVEDAEQWGRSLGLLFSAIPPGMYERLGFRIAPAHAWTCTDPRGLSEAEAGAGAELLPIDPYRHLGGLDRLFHGTRGGLYLWRDEAAWRRNVALNSADVFFALGALERGYVRLVDGEGELEIVELCLADPGDERAALAAVARLAVELGRERMVGWMDPSAAVREHFEPGTREETLPMVRGDVPLARSRFWASEYF